MAFQFRLEHEDRSPADPPTLKAAVPDRRAGDTIPLSAGRTLRVVATKADQPTVLIVEDVAERASGDAP